MRVSVNSFHKLPQKGSSFGLFGSVSSSLPLSCCLEFGCDDLNQAAVVDYKVIMNMKFTDSGTARWKDSPAR